MYGFILWDRLRFSDFLIDKPPLWTKMWAFMLSQAYFKDTKKLKRGQLFVKKGEMREKMGHWKGSVYERPTPKQIRYCYECLVNEGWISTSKTTRGMIITICNYDQMQQMKSYDSHLDCNSDCHTNVAAMAHDKEQKEQKERKKNTFRDKQSAFSIRSHCYPDWLNKDLWFDFVEMRAKIRRPITSKIAVTRLLNKLEELINGGYSQDEIIGLALEKSYLAFYPPNSPGTSATLSDAEKKQREKVCNELGE